MKIYQRILSVLYAFGALLHVLDVFSVRLNFSEMSTGWKAWIVFLLIFDTVAAIGLWRGKRWGTASFLFVTFTQLISYTLFKDFFGDQKFLVTFHLVTLAIFFTLYIKNSRKA